MRRGMVASGVLALFVGSLLLVSMAEARVGGGGSMGSRGSRSFSAPRAPSSPGDSQRSLSTPARPTPQAPGGFMGRWGGMLGGLLLGGLLGSLLFGGLGHGLFGGIGLLEIIVVAGLAYLAVSLFRRRQLAPAMGPAGGGRASWGPSVEPSARANGPAGVVADGELDRGLTAIRLMDPGFDPARFIAMASDLFQRVQGAWSARDLSPVRDQLTREMTSTLEAQLATGSASRRVNRIEKVSIEAAQVTETWQELGTDFLTVRFRASALDYTQDETTGAVVEGSRSVPTSFEEYWTFGRPVGPNPWRLSAIQQPPA